MGRIAALLAVRRRLRPQTGYRRQEPQAARRVEPIPGHLPGQHHPGGPQRRADQRDRYEPLHLLGNQPRRLRDPRVAEQTPLGIADQGVHRLTGQARGRAGVVPEYPDQDAGIDDMVNSTLIFYDWL